ncbi:MAG TPA: hypothetical protein DCZ97_06725 [Syntrophus sp. (in: bacteria)]|nr:hypothetical protein [Syntrophus sp. (in: bacteria)]
MEAKKAKKKIGNEKGLVLVVALLLITVLVLLSSTAITTTTTDMKIAGNYKEGVRALYDAEAGIHYTIGLLRSSTVTLPTTLNVPTPPTPAVTPPTGFSFSGIALTNLGSDRYQLSARGNAAIGAQKALEAIFTKTSAAPPVGEGAMAMYGNSPTVQLKVGLGGGVDVDGHNYPLPPDFTCQGSSCRTAGSDIGAKTGLYTASAPTITGNLAHLAGDPPQTTGGGISTNQQWIDFVDYVIGNGLYVTNQLGTRAAPLITRVPSGSTLGGNMDGAGIIIVDDGGAMSVGGTGHFEGLVILRGTGTFIGNGTGSIFGSVITIDHAAKTVGLDGTVDILYSSQALGNLSNIGSLQTIRVTSWKDTSLE